MSLEYQFGGLWTDIETVSLNPGGIISVGAASFKGILEAGGKVTITTSPPAPIFQPVFPPSIGAVVRDGRGNTFYGECRVDEGIKVEDSALEINGFTKEQVNNPLTQGLDHLMLDYVTWAYPEPVITLSGENVGHFDLPGIKVSLEKHGLKDVFGLKDIFGHRSRDLHTTVLNFHDLNAIPYPMKDKHDDISLDYALKFLGMETESKPHNAHMGAILEVEGFSRIMRGVGLIEEFKRYPVPEVVAKARVRG